MEGIFLFRPKGGKLNPYNKFDFERYIIQNEDVELIAHFEESANSSEKMKMYAFYNGPVLDVAMSGYRRQGYVGDKVVTDYRLRAEFAKKINVNPNGKTDIVVMGQSSMSKKRYHQFLCDVLLFIEEELEMEVPDAQAYKDLLYFKNRKEQKTRNNNQ